MQHHRHAIRDAHEAEAEECVRSCFSHTVAIEADQDTPQQHAEQRADAESRSDRPHQIDSPPAPAGGTDIVQGEQSEAQHHEWKGRSVV